MRLSDQFFPDVEVVHCDCGRSIRHRPDRWKVRCNGCGATGHLHKLRCEWRQCQPNAKADDAKRDKILKDAGYD